MRTSLKSIAQMPVQVVACKSIMVDAKMVAAGTEFTMLLEDYNLAAGENIELAPGEEQRINLAILATHTKPKTRAERQAEDAAKLVETRTALTSIVAMSAARDAEAVRRRDALERLIQAEMGGGN
ncbi:hypothetical protein [Pseudomonas coronafaciens]|uniref:hypothetical protein n=1 Tax=Pseudomonas coronafaciens TaxID=53409 RepID=UPI000F17EC7B|nr:hypothetical protein [Pseudomonas coronafaciens]RMV68314.1 hypothetical protein ALP06_03995 [Pseudomonas coronafaciens pv. atropurpurea]